MKVVIKVSLALFVFAAVSSAQIDLMELEGSNNPYIIDNFTDFEGERTWSSVDCNSASVFEVVADPEDAANMVGSFKSTSCTDEGFALDQTFVPFDFSLHTHMSLDVYAPSAGRKIVFKIFNSADPAQAKIVELMSEKAAEWDTLNFDFSGTTAGMYDRFSIHPDFGETGTGVEWLFDNIRKDRGGLVTYRNDGMLVDFDTLLPYLHFWGCAPVTDEFIIAENPLKDAVNSSDYCGLFFSTDCQWEGFAIAEKLEPLDFSVVNQARVKVLAPGPDLQIMFKVELWENSGIMVETTAMTTVGNAWEEVVFDLSGVESFKYTKVAVFPDFLATSTDEEWYIDDVRIVDPNNVSVKTDKVIKVFALSAKNYPNPYNPTTTISYNVPLPSNVKVTVYDVNGRELQTLVNEYQTNGGHQVQFDASNLSSGVYVYKVETSYDAVVGKMVLMR